MSKPNLMVVQASCQEVGEQLRDLLSVSGERIPYGVFAMTEEATVIVTNLPAEKVPEFLRMLAKSREANLHVEGGEESGEEAAGR